jgi:hypothetical protein
LITRNNQQLKETLTRIRKEKDMFYLTISILTTTTRTYNVQTRAKKGVATPPRALANMSPPRHTSAFLPGEVPPHLTGYIPIAGLTTALHSNVVASRPPSLREETTALISACSSEDAESPMEPASDRSWNEALVIVSRNINYDKINELTSSEARVFHLDREESEGNQLRRTAINRTRRAYSPGSKEGTQNASNKRAHIVHAPNKVQEQVFKPTTQRSLTAIEKQRWSSWLRRREKSLAIRRHRYSESPRGQRLSNPKEMSVDTRECVQVNITHLIREDRDQESLNVVAQMLATALNSLNQWNEKFTDKTMNSDLEIRGEREKTRQSLHAHTIQSTDPVGSCPEARMVNANYLGAARLPALEKIIHQ